MDKLKEEGRHYFQKGDYAMAIEAYSKALAIDATDHILFSNRSACHLKLGHLNDALNDALMCTRIAPLWGKGYSRLGDALFAMKRYFSALRWFQNGVRLDPNNDHMLEMIEILKKEIPEGAEDDDSPHSDPDGYPLKTANSSRSSGSPDSGDDAHTIDSLKEAGNRAFQAGDYLNAVECYTIAVEADPTNAKLLSNRSACYCLLRRYKKALDDANHVVQLQPNWAKGYSRRGDALQAMSCLRMAISAYAMGLELDPKNKHMKEEMKKLQLEVDEEDKKKPRKVTPPPPVQLAAPTSPNTPTPITPLVPAATSTPLRRHASAQVLLERTTSERQAPAPVQAVAAAAATPVVAAVTPVVAAAPAPAVAAVAPMESFKIHPSARTETVTKHWYDSATKMWYEKQITVQLEEKPFQEGSMRLAFRMFDFSSPPGNRCHVAKVFKPGLRCGQEQIWSDVEMYEICSSMAGAFNQLKPPKMVSFCHCFLIVRALSVPRHMRVMFVEPYLTGTFTKYNNNDGWCSADDRNTPQAFSHFSYEHSRHELLVVDIQGVGDVYTDPQIHTRTGQDFGPGNCGREGIQRFFSTHVCNPVCHFLKLPLYRRYLKEGGTKVTANFKMRKVSNK